MTLKEQDNNILPSSSDEGELYTFEKSKSQYTNEGMAHPINGWDDFNVFA